MPRRRPGLFSPGHGFVVSHGQTVVPAKTFADAMHVAVAEARRFDTVTHVVAKDKRRGGGISTLATCIPEPKRSGKRRIITCHIHARLKRKKR